MKKALYIFLFLIVLLLLSLGIAVAVGVNQPRVYEGLINKIVYKNTGYHYSTEKVDLQISPTKVYVQGFVLKNPEWSQDLELLSAEEIEVSLEML